MRFYWASLFGGQPIQTEQKSSIFGQGTFPTPGAVLLSEGAVSAEILGPQLIDGVMNEFRFLDPPADTMPMKIPLPPLPTKLPALGGAIGVVTLVSLLVAAGWAATRIWRPARRPRRLLY